MASADTAKPPSPARLTRRNLFNFERSRRQGLGESTDSMRTPSQTTSERRAILKRQNPSWHFDFEGPLNPPKEPVQKEEEPPTEPVQEPVQEQCGPYFGMNGRGFVRLRRKVIWDHKKQFAKMQDAMRRIAREGDNGSLSTRESLDVNVFASDPDANGSWDDYNKQESEETKADAATASIPADFPPHKKIDSAVEMGAYLSSSKYIVSFGGSPLPDLQYGIWIVPVGDESLLFRPNHETHPLSEDALAGVADARKMARNEVKKEIQKVKKLFDKYWDKEPPDWSLNDDEREFYREFCLKYERADLLFDKPEPFPWQTAYADPYPEETPKEILNDDSSSSSPSVPSVKSFGYGGSQLPPLFDFGTLSSGNNRDGQAKIDLSASGLQMLEYLLKEVTDKKKLDAAQEGNTAGDKPAENDAADSQDKDETGSGVFKVPDALDLLDVADTIRNMVLGHTEENPGVDEAVWRIAQKRLGNGPGEKEAGEKEPGEKEPGEKEPSEKEPSEKEE